MPKPGRAGDGSTHGGAWGAELWPRRSGGCWQLSISSLEHTQHRLITWRLYPLLCPLLWYALKLRKLGTEVYSVGRYRKIGDSWQPQYFPFWSCGCVSARSLAMSTVPYYLGACRQCSTSLSPNRLKQIQNVGTQKCHKVMATIWLYFVTVGADRCLHNELGKETESLQLHGKYLNYWWINNWLIVHTIKLIEVQNYVP